MSQAEFSYPKGTRVIQAFWKFILMLFGWKTEGQYPEHPKSVLIFAPHTSNWDFVYMLLSLFSLGIKPNWLGKKELFFWPAKYLFSALGGYPVDRSGSLSTVKATLRLFKNQDQVLLGIAPEGTRSKSEYWKTGFYHIAKKANVPINFCYLNYRDKVGGISEGFKPTGDIDKDMAYVSNFYTEKMKLAKFPNDVGAVKIKQNKTRVGGKV